MLDISKIKKLKNILWPTVLKQFVCAVSKEDWWLKTEIICKESLEGIIFPWEKATKTWGVGEARNALKQRRENKSSLTPNARCIKLTWCELTKLDQKPRFWESRALRLNQSHASLISLGEISLKRARSQFKSWSHHIEVAIWAMVGISTIKFVDGKWQ